MAIENPPEAPARPGELTVALPQASDAQLRFIGRIRTQFATRADCPRNIRETDRPATVEIDAPFHPALLELDLFSHAILLYWMHEARRDLLHQIPKHLARPRGTFALRSPARPNPIALAVVPLLGIDAAAGLIAVGPVDCIDGTPLLDIKPYFATVDSVPDARRPA